MFTFLVYRYFSSLPVIFESVEVFGSQRSVLTTCRMADKGHYSRAAGMRDIVLKQSKFTICNDANLEYRASQACRLNFKHVFTTSCLPSDTRVPLSDGFDDRCITDFSVCENTRDARIRENCDTRRRKLSGRSQSKIFSFPF